MCASRWPALALCLILAGALGGGLAQGQSKKRRARPQLVVVSPVQVVTDVPKGSFTAILEPAEKAMISVDEPGKVAQMLKRQGDYVKRQGVVARLTNTSLTLELEVLETGVQETLAQLDQGRIKLRRVEKLFRMKLASAEQFEDEAAAFRVAQAQLENRKAQARRLRQKLALMTVRAPFAGQVVKVDLEVGQWVTPTKPIYEIYNYDRFELLVGVPAKYMRQVPNGALVDIHVADIAQKLKGRIVSVTRHVDAASGNFSVRVRVENPRRHSLSGLIARVEVPLGRVSQKITVPRDAIVRRGGRTHVVVVRKGLAQVINVKVEGNLIDQVIVTSADLTPEDTVVVRGNERLYSGTPVKVTGTM